MGAGILRIFSITLRKEEVNRTKCFIGEIGI